MMDDSIRQNGIFMQDVMHDGAPIQHIKQDGVSLWTRNETVADRFFYSVAQSNRLDVASNSAWVNVDNGSLYMRISSVSGPYASNTSSDGQYRLRSYYHKPFKGYNMRVSITFQEALDNDRIVGLSLGGLGGSGAPPIYFLYASSNGLYVTRGSSIPTSGHIATLYSNSSVNWFASGDTISLSRTWVNTTTDKLTVYVGNTILTTFNTPNLKNIPVQFKNIDQTVNYAGIVSSFHRAYFQNYYATSIDGFEAYTF